MVVSAMTMRPRRIIVRMSVQTVLTTARIQKCPQSKKQRRMRIRMYNREGGRQRRGNFLVGSTLPKGRSDSELSTAMGSKD